MQFSRGLVKPSLLGRKWSRCGAIHREFGLGSYSELGGDVFALCCECVRVIDSGRATVLGAFGKRNGHQISQYRS
jgi:hypothetical protein